MTKAVKVLITLCFLPLLLQAQETEDNTNESTFLPRIEQNVMYGNLMGKYNAEFQNGVALNYVGTYRINPYLGLGAGASAQTYRFTAGSSFFPLTAVIRGYISPYAKVQPYWQAALGYGFALDQRDEETLLVDARGGFNGSGAIGLEIPMRDALSFMMSLGYQYQKGESTYDFAGWWWGEQQEVQKLTFQRIHFQVGIKF